MPRAAIKRCTECRRWFRPVASAGTRQCVCGAECREARRQRAGADPEEGRWLLEAQRCAAHVHLGFGSFSEYVERSFGYKPRSTLEKLRVAEALEALPALA